jgi:RNA polymerase sigma factor for flagellar operon FliA
METGIDIWIRYRENKSEEIREDIVLRYAHLVKYVAGRLSINLPPSVDFDDLISFGTFGLLDAIEKYDVMREVKFETYAITRIRGSIIDGLRKNDWIPRSIRERSKDFETKIRELETKLGRTPSNKELCVYLSLTPEEVDSRLIDLSSANMIYMDENIELDLKDKTNSDSPEEIIEKNYIKSVIRDVIQKLNQQEKIVVTLFYYEGLSKKEISEILNVSQSRVSQIHSKALIRLKNALGNFSSLLF